MHPTFILPPSLGTQRQSPKKKNPSRKKQATFLRKPEPALFKSAALQPVPPPNALHLPHSPTVNTAANISGHNGAQERQQLKRKADDLSTAEHQPNTHKFLDRPAASVQQLHSTQQHVASQSRPQLLLEEDCAVPTPSVASQRLDISNPARNHTVLGPPLTLPDRKKVAVSQLARRLVFAPSIVSTIQGSQRPSQVSSRPTPADTIPNQLHLLQKPDPSKSRKSSDVARSIILPKTGISTANSRNRKKTKFVPPLVRGGYAERLADLMTYHKSEYTMWANATLRKDKLFGSTEPLATVEVKQISMHHNLQWTHCSVIFDEKNKPPFDMDYAKDQQPCDQHPSTPVSALLDFKASSAVPNEMEIEIVKCTPSQDLEATVGNVSFASQSQDEDSIDGLHTDMRQLGVLSSPQGSVFEDSIGDFIWSQRRLNTREEPVLTIIDETEEENSSGNSLWFVKSSQDSEIDFEEQNEFLGRREGINHPRRVSPQANDTLDLTCTKNAISHDNNIAYEVIEGEEDTVLNSDENVQRTTSTVSTIDDRSSDSEREQLTTGGSPREVSVPAHIIQTSVEATPDFIIVFSNLFNWSTLKVSDKVEIHEPCRRIAMPEFGPTEYGAAAWIVERYKVVSS